MKNYTYLLHRFTRDKWFRLGTAIVLALFWVVTVLFMPITTNGTQIPGLADGATFGFMPFKPEIVRAFGGISVTKQVISATVGQGQVLTYTLNFANNSGADLIGGVEFFITDTIPVDTGVPVTVFASADGNWLASFDAGQRRVSWLWSVSAKGNIPAGYTTAVTYSVVVGEPLPDQQIITNSAGSYTIYRVNPDLTNTTLDIGAADITTTVTAPEWQISKVADPSPFVQPGDTITYTLTVTNTGHLTTSGSYTITDEVPVNTEYVSALPTPETGGPDFVRWVSTSEIGPDQAITVSYTVVVTQPLPNAVEIVNQTYSITGGNVYSEAFGPPVMVTVQTPVTLTVTKLDGPDPVQAGELISYTLTVINDSSSKGPAADVVVTDTIPANTSLVEASFVGTATGAITNTGSVITWTLASPNPLLIGEQAVVSMTVRVDSPLTNSTIITNETYGVSVTNDIFTVNGVTPVTTVVGSAPILDITKEGLPDPVNAGGQLTYTIRYTNSGNAHATDVLISDTFPISTSYVGDISQPDVSPGITTTEGITWNIPFLAGAGGGGVITLTLSVDAPQDPGTVLTNVIAITSSEVITPVLFTETTEISSTPQLHIAKFADPSPVATGSTLTYTIVFSNSGNADASGAIITDVLDSNVAFMGASGGGVHNSGVVTWTGLNVPADGLTQTLEFSVTVATMLPNNSLLTNNVEFVAGDVRATDTLTTLVQAPALAITKIVSPTGIIRAGDNIEYTIIYTNTGPITITVPGIDITDTFPVSITNVVSSTGSSDGTPPGPQATPFVWHDDEVPPNGSATITITGQVITSPWAASGGQIINDVVVAGIGYSATATISNEGRPGLPATFVITATPATTEAGHNIQVDIRAEDVYGNPVFNSTPITLTTSLAGSTLNGSLSSTFLSTSGGDATATLFSTVAGTTTLTAQIAGASGTMTTTTVATFTPAAVIGFVLQATTPQTAGVAFPITIRAVDAFSNTVTTVNQPITISDTTGTIAPTSALLAGGIATPTFVITRATSPALDTIMAISGSITGTVNVVILPNTPTILAVTVNPAAIRVCQTANVTTTITDDFGNAIRDKSVNLTISPGATTDFSPNPGTTNNAGIFTSILTGRTPGSPSSIQATSMSPTLTDLTNVNVITPAMPTNLSLSVSPNPLATGGNTATVTATVTDCFGPSSGQVVTFTVSNALASLPATPFVTTTNTGGVATAILTSNSIPQDGTLVVTATVGSLVQTATVTLQTAVLTITKTADPTSGTEVRPGQTINYTLQVTNQGSGPATTVVITDVLPAGVSFVSCNSAATCSGGSTTTVTAPTLGAGQAIAATIQVAVAAPTSGTVISNQATVRSSQTGLMTSNVVAHTVTTATVDLFLPFILKDFAPVPDLRITSFTVTGTNPNRMVTIVVENGGNVPTSEGFWVDFYVNPTTLPDNPDLGGNRRWELLGSTQGIAWAIPELNAGESITLTSNGAAGTVAPAPSPLSNWNGTLPGGANNLYAFVDSFDAEGASFGEIAESNENNNIASEVITAAAGPEIGTSSVPDLDNLPPRWKP